jgi:hypothetical protein
VKRVFGLGLSGPGTTRHGRPAFVINPWFARMNFSAPDFGPWKLSRYVHFLVRRFTYSTFQVFAMPIRCCKKCAKCKSLKYLGPFSDCCGTHATFCGGAALASAEDPTHE